MRLTRESEIAVHTLLACAARPSEMVQTREIARASGTTKDYSAHIVARLVHAGFLRSYRGRKGGRRPILRPPSTWWCAWRQNSFLATLDDFTLADLAAGADTGRLVCLDCDLKTTVLRSRALIMSGVAREPSAPGRSPTRERTLQHVWG